MDDHKNGDPVDQRLAVYTTLPTLKIQEYQDKANLLAMVLETYDVQSKADADKLGGLLGSVHKELQELDAIRLEAGKPAREAQKDINTFFKPTLDQYKAVKGKIKQLIGDYEKAVAASYDEAIAKASTGDTTALAQVAPAAPTAGTRTQRRLEIKVVDFDQVPREYLCVDYSALKILAKQGGKAPAGIAFEYRDEIMVGRMK